MAAPRQSPPPRNQRRLRRRRGVFLVAHPAQQEPERAQEEQQGGHIGTDLQRLLDEDRLRREEETCEKTDGAIGGQASQPNGENNGQRAQPERDEPTEKQKVPRRFEGLVDGKPAEERRQPEVVPGRVVLEEVLVGKQPLEHAPGRVRVLELVRIEDPARDQEDARDEERDDDGEGGEDDERAGELTPRSAPLGQPLMIVLRHRSTAAAGYLKMASRARASAR